MKVRNLVSCLVITVLAVSQVTFATSIIAGNSPISTPITSPITTPITSPIIPPQVNKFTNLSANMPGAGSATFNFTYSGFPLNYFYVNASTTADMSWDVYWKFTEGQNSPISLNNPIKWDKYSCGRTLYWQVVSITGDKSPIQRTTVACTAPIPVGTFSNLSANLTGTSAFFNFNYAGPLVSGYSIDMSTYHDMSWDVYMNFASSSYGLPAAVLSPQTRWDKYACGRTLYWRIYDGNRRAVSPIQTAVVTCAVPAIPVATITPSLNLSPIVTSSPVLRQLPASIPAAKSAVIKPVVTPKPVIKPVAVNNRFISPIQNIVNKFMLPLKGILQTLRFW